MECITFDFKGSSGNKLKQEVKSNNQNLELEEWTLWFVSFVTEYDQYMYL